MRNGTEIVELEGLLLSLIGHIRSVRLYFFWAHSCVEKD